MLWFGGTGYSNIRTIIEKIAVIPSKTLELLHFFLALNYTRQKCKINNIWSNTLSIYHVKEWGEQVFLNVELNAGTPTAPLKTEIPSDFPVFQIDASLRCQAIPLRWNQKSVSTFLQHSRNQTTDEVSIFYNRGVKERTDRNPVESILTFIGDTKMKNVLLLTGAGQIGMAIARRMGYGMKIVVGDKSRKAHRPSQKP